MVREDQIFWSPTTVVLSYIQEMNRGNIAKVYEKYMADDFVRYGPETEWGPMPRSTYVAWGVSFEEAFPDLRWEVITVMESHNVVIVELVETATFKSPWDLGHVVVQPNGEPYSTHAVLFFRIEGQKIKSYKYTHDHGFMKAYGHIFPGPDVTDVVMKQA